ncbi:DNA-binding CsgD family transcriptional regulator [Chryseobacterium vietnamense]|uniref:DNA-binding CsgD family transcriptional regulator n=1 Tax=Chryseobacterium vietnamense TaxID=866785 RepID=A0ACC6J661_9FLAO|nr:LuxR C-terminal-related transcriptional regulator [Chryseobacterium vietnamense]MDR6458539.1 DNA-binding CsgD family transcriptional regulator [Chryseobacterium vietnamense]MDR6487160.1 DNA-binding CsgD family transcriptional regulator [Chryseobacterium vietnamense]
MSDKINSLYARNASGISVSGKKNASDRYLNVLKAVSETSLGCIYIADLKTKKLEFISENPLLFSGLSSAEVEKMGYNFFRKYTKKEDLEILKKVSTYGFQFFECLSPEEKKVHTITYDFHLKYTNSIDVLVNHKITPIELYDDGEISKIVCVASYSLNRSAGNIRIVSNASETYWKYNLSTGKWTEESKVALKLREIEILRLYLQGLKIEEIAEQLFVSPSTIKFHRSKLFERIGVKNIIEAISYVITNNLI